jgi:ubiquinone/menaquinone biosynthesis C-methylase UbiE
MKRGQISKILRTLGLIYFTDWIRFYIEKNKNKKENKDFKKNHPNVVLPPDYLMYESFQINYKKYYTDSIETAKWLTNHFKKHIELKKVKVLDWGCGPGRIIRHLPEIIGNDSEYFGTDYNNKTITWCRQNLKGISFNQNTLKETLPYSENYFDIIYGISIFTHLSEQLHYEWYNELFRILKPNGIMFLTTQGDNFKIKLTDTEVQDYDNGLLIVRGKVKEGHRTYSAFHPKKFMMELFKNTEILEHIVIPYKKGKLPPQDIWIIKKK